MLLSKPMLSVRHAVSTDEYRRSMCGVRLDPAKNRTIATNGHFLLMATAHEGGPKPEEFPSNPNGDAKPLDHPVTIPTTAVEAMRKAIPKKSKCPILLKALVTNGQPDRVSIGTTDLDTWNAQEVKIIEESFPDVEQVIPKDGKGLRIAFSPSYLATICYAVQEAGGKSIILTMPTGKEAELHPVRFDAEGNEVSIIGVLMPMRL